MMGREMSSLPMSGSCKDCAKKLSVRTYMEKGIGLHNNYYQAHSVIVTVSDTYLIFAQVGVSQLQDGKIDPPDAVMAATEGYRVEQDMLADFLNDCCIQDASANVLTSTLYDAYSRYAGKGAMSSKMLTLAFQERGFIKNRVTKGAQKGKFAWIGIGLRVDEE